jgi:hypothetical protein
VKKCKGQIFKRLGPSSRSRSCIRLTVMTLITVIITAAVITVTRDEAHTTAAARGAHSQDSWVKCAHSDGFCDVTYLVPSLRSL